MSNAPGGLSDALRDLADGVQELPIEQDDHEYHEVPDQAQRRTSSSSAAPARSSSTARRSAQRSGSSSSTRRATGTSRPGGSAHASNIKLKLMAVPALIGVGFLLMLPGIWSILILLDREVIGYDSSGAKNMAYAMLAAWPLSLFMFAGAGFFFWQVQRMKKQAETQASSGRSSARRR